MDLYFLLLHIQVNEVTLTYFGKLFVTSEVYSKPCQIYEDEALCKNRKVLTIFYILDFWQRSEYASEVPPPKTSRFTLMKTVFLESFLYSAGGLDLKLLRVFIKSCFASLDVYMQTCSLLSIKLFAGWYAWVIKWYAWIMKVDHQYQCKN